MVIFSCVCLFSFARLTSFRDALFPRVFYLLGYRDILAELEKLKVNHSLQVTFVHKGLSTYLHT